MYKFSKLLECVNEQEGPEDAEIHCKNEVIKFHKTMLMKVSDVFENMLTNPNFKESQNGIILIENDEISSTSPNTIKTFKDILYQKIVDNDDLDVDLMLFADSLIDTTSHQLSRFAVKNFVNHIQKKIF